MNIIGFKIIGLTALVTLLLAISANAETLIGDCTTISSPGEYVLRHDILNSPAVSCIKITSSDVVFDGAGFTIGGTKANFTAVFLFMTLQRLLQM